MNFVRAKGGYFYKNKNFQIQKKRTTESTMDLEASLNQVLQVLRNSGLHFSAQETPHSLYISIRKKFKQNREASSQFVPIPSSKNDEKIRDLTKECKLLENSLERAKHELIQEIDDHKRTVKEKVEVREGFKNKKTNLIGIFQLGSRPPPPPPIGKKK